LIRVALRSASESEAVGEEEPIGAENLNPVAGIAEASDRWLPNPRRSVAENKPLKDRDPDQQERGGFGDGIALQRRGEEDPALSSGDGVNRKACSRPL
jgi:hypothetical protein